MAFILNKDKKDLQSTALNPTQQVTDTLGSTNGGATGQKQLSTPNAAAFLNANAGQNTTGQSSRLTSQSDTAFQDALSRQNQKAQSFQSSLTPPPSFSARDVGKSDPTTQAAGGFLTASPNVQKQDYSARIDNPFESDKAFQNSLSQLNRGNNSFNRLDAYLAGKTGARDAAKARVVGQNQSLLQNAQNLAQNQDAQTQNYNQSFAQAQANLMGDLQRQQDALYRQADNAQRQLAATNPQALAQAKAQTSLFNIDPTKYVTQAELGTQGDYLSAPEAEEFNRLSQLLGGKAISRSGVAPTGARFDQAAFDQAIKQAGSDAVRMLPPQKEKSPLDVPLPGDIGPRYQTTPREALDQLNEAKKTMNQYQSNPASFTRVGKLLGI